MACVKALSVVALVAAVVARHVTHAALPEGYGRGGPGGFGAGGFGAGGGAGGQGGDGAPRPYNFEYAVKDAESGNDYGHRESSDGRTVQGEYRVLLPDGRRQIVTYTADDASGYNAEVKYEGQASAGAGAGGVRPGGAGGYGAGGGLPSPVYLPPGRK